MKMTSLIKLPNLAIISLCLLGTVLAGGGGKRHKQHPWPDHANHHGYKTIVIDVACDGRTFGAIGLGNDGIQRGTSFIVDGAIYPGGTIPEGNGFDIDANTESIGRWVCRGTFNLSAAEMGAGLVPHVSTTQQYLFGDGDADEITDTLASEGQEGGTNTTRLVMGGSGKFRGIVGDVRQESLGTNTTQFENFRFTFKVKK